MSRSSQETGVKKNLRAFCGFDDTADVDKKKESIRKKDLVAVKKMLAVCDQQLSGTKEDCLMRLLDFLKKPTASGKKSIKEAATAKRKRSTVRCPQTHAPRPTPRCEFLDGDAHDSQK